MVDIIPLSRKLQEIATNQLNEVSTRMPDDLRILKLWISQQPHLKVRPDDRLLLQFLRGSKYSLEKAKERIDLYYTLKSRYPELFQVTNVKSPAMKEIINLGCFAPLPRPLNDDGPAMAVFRFNFIAPQHNINDIIGYMSVLQEMAYICDPYACIAGIIYIADLKKLSAGYIPYLTPSLLKKFFDYFVKSLPYRVKAVYLINNPPVVMQLFKMILSFLPNKMKQRVHLCGCGVQELTTHLPLEFLPTDYGGQNGSLAERSMWLQETIYENEQYFAESIRYGSDESLRPGKPLNFGSIYGMDGTFRKLEVD